MKDYNRDSDRYEVLFPVLVESSVYGEFCCIARNISEGGIFLETVEPLPLGTKLQIHFSESQSGTRLSANGVVRNHFFFNYGPNHAPKQVTGMGIKIHSYDNTGAKRKIEGEFHATLGSN